MLLIVSLFLACSVTFLRQQRLACPEVTSPSVGWTLPHQLATKNNAQQTCPQVNQMEVIPQLRFPLFQGVLG